MRDEEACCLTEGDVIYLRHLANDAFAEAKALAKRIPKTARGHLHNALHWRDMANANDAFHARRTRCTCLTCRRAKSRL